MQIKGPSTPFSFLSPLAEPSSKEATGSGRDAAAPDAHPALKPMPRFLGQSQAFLLRQKLANGGAPARTAQLPQRRKADRPAESGAAMPETALRLSTDAQMLHDSPASRLSPAAAMTKVVLGKPEERSAAQEYLADLANPVIGPGGWTVADELALWTDRLLTRPGF